MMETVGAMLPFTCEQVFDLAADIERYPEFLKWWISASIRKRESNIWYVEQIMGMGPVRLQFVSQAVLDRPRRIDVTSTDRRFRKYDLCWVIAATAPIGCRVNVTAEFELQSRFLQQALDRVLPYAISDVIAAFVARAHLLYAGSE